MTKGGVWRRRGGVWRSETNREIESDLVGKSNQMEDDELRAVFTIFDRVALDLDLGAPEIFRSGRPWK